MSSTPKALAVIYYETAPATQQDWRPIEEQAFRMLFVDGGRSMQSIDGLFKLMQEGNRIVWEGRQYRMMRPAGDKPKGGQA